MMNFPIILATARDGRMSEAVANTIKQYTTSLLHIEAPLIDVREYGHAVTMNEEQENKQMSEWCTMAENADGFIVVIPEYNHSFPGEFKLAWDIGYDEYRHKPLLVCSVSSGSFGGIRVIEHLRSLWGCFFMPVAAELYVSHVADNVVEGVYHEAKFSERLVTGINTLEAYAIGMQSVREKLSLKNKRSA